MGKIVLHVITGLNDGGAESVLFRLCTHDRSRRHHVISLIDSGKYGPLLERAGVGLTCLNMPRGRITLRGMGTLWKFIRQTRPDVVQTWMYHADLLAGLVARFAGCRHVVWGIRHTTLDARESPRSTILVARICAFISRVVPWRIVCCAEKAREVHIALGYKGSIMHVIPNGYDLSVFYPNPDSGLPVRNQLGLPLNTPLIGFVARFNPQKDHSNLLQALALLKNSGRTVPTCLLVGTGMEEENPTLTGEIDRLGLKRYVHLAGRRSDVPSVMNALDLHVMSSSFGEAFPNVLAEAMACGTPCVATDVGDAGLIVGDTGWIVPPRDPGRLAEAIFEAIEEWGTSRWARRKRNARERVQDLFSIEKMVSRYHQVWDR